jgi:hypothetical protein
MKKLFFLFPALMFACTASAQYHAESPYIYDSYYWDYSYFEGNNNGFDIQMIKNKHVKEMTEIRLKHDKERKSYIYDFDDKGRSTKMTDYWYMFGKLFRERTYTSNGFKKMPDYLSVDRKGKEIRKNSYIYNNDTLITEESKFKRGKFFARILNKYDSTRTIESFYYKKDQDQPKRRWVYEYYPDHSKKSSTLYDEKGKIKYVWNYECKPEGELAKKHKDTTAICRTEETDKDGNKTVTLRKFNAKGKPYKEVSVYNKDNKMIEMRYYNSKDIIYYRYVQNPDHLITAWYNYNRKGIENNRYEYLYNPKKKLLETAQYRHQNILVWKEVNEYNNMDYLVASKYFGRKGKTRSETKYTYENDLLVACKTTDRKGKMIYEGKYTYLFY